MNFFPNRLTSNAPTSSTDQGWEPVTRYTRASAFGRVIRCPHCGTTARVFHFSWSTCTCQGCDRMVDKYAYTTPAK
jgi:ribosomal protein S27E